jgi:hypothetical protein
VAERRGSTDLIVDRFYESLASDDQWAMRPGQLYYAHAVYPTDYPEILKPDRPDPKLERDLTFTIKPYSDGDETHVPIKELKLRDKELLYVYRGKRRLVIVLGVCVQSWYHDAKGENILLCAPVFGFKPRHTQEKVIRTQAFDFHNLFYLPPDLDGCRDESAVRFEFIQPVMGSCLDVFKGFRSGLPVRLSDTAMNLLLVHLLAFLNRGLPSGLAPEGHADATAIARLTDDIKAYGQLLLDDFRAGQQP